MLNQLIPYPALTDRAISANQFQLDQPLHCECLFQGGFADIALLNGTV